MIYSAALFNSIPLRVMPRTRSIKYLPFFSHILCPSSAVISPYAVVTCSRHLDSTFQCFSNTATSKFTPTEDRKYQFFRNVEITSNEIAIIRFDSLNKKVNTLSFAAKDEASALWEQEILNNSSVKAVVFTSSKHKSFIVGADIFDIQSLEDKSDIATHIESAFRLFRSMQSKKIPLVCAINGDALGGGLEWTLWCDYRVCTDNEKVKLGLPEVKLGLLPGFGGTQNLHQLIGLQKSMDMMLTGKNIAPKQALKIGLVDRVVAPQSLESVALDVAEGLAIGSLKKKPRKISIMDKFIENTYPGRYLMWKKINEMIQKNTSGNYPAPLAIIDCVKYGLSHSRGDQKYVHEREAFAKLAATRESEALIGIFDGMNKLKKHKYSNVDSTPVKQIAIMGSGLMGAGICQISAERGYKVLLTDRDIVGVSRGLDYMHSNWNKKLKRKKMSQYTWNCLDANVISVSPDMSHYATQLYNADLIIEAVYEDLDVKTKIVQQCEAITKNHCVFATNTSAIPIRDIAKKAKRPQNIIGMHYFSPVPQMPLLEIIPHEATADSTKTMAFMVGKQQGKTCIEVKDVPGFYINRCLGPFLVEVSALVQDGVQLLDLDKAMIKFGMPVGPITLADEVGVDVTSHVATFLSNADLGARMTGGDISLMECMIAKGWLGKKSGQGFYTYKKGKKQPKISPEVESYVNAFRVKNLNLKEDEVQDRIVTRFVNEAVKCLEDEIIANPVVGDIGLVYGTGFAPFRGGPFRYLDTIGIDFFVGKMNDLAAKYGSQFEPCQLLKDYSVSGKKFHS